MSAIAENTNNTNPQAAPAAPAASTTTPQQQQQQQQQQPAVSQQNQQQTPQHQQQQQHQHQHQHQQQQQSQTPVQPAPPATPTAAPGDSLVCQWQNCGERCATAESLYEHVCERHVGRKSTNNLCLQCQWGTCRTTTVKRDHITSHIRVHVPLKPHKCDFCGKTFKRPQDLKKHVKTHADDSVLLRSPEPNRAPHGSSGGGYAAQAGKHVADLQALAGAASGFYQDGMGPNSGYPHPYSGANANAFAGSAPSNSAYGPVFYQVSGPNVQSDFASREATKALMWQTLNEFFGDVKRRAIDPTSYYDVGQRLLSVQGQLPLLAGYSGDYQPQPAMVSPTGHGPSSQHHYSLPMPMSNLRTKNDLLEIDKALETLQTTIYESPQQVAAAGSGQPGAHYIHPGFNYRSSNSPPAAHTTQPQTTHATALAPHTAPQSETPALTPASSVMSYTSGQSPGSVNSSNTISPVTRPNISMYPTLPSVSAMSDMAGGYSATSSAPNLAPFDSDGRRRWSGNQLQKARPSVDENAMDISEDGPTPSASRRSSVDRDGLRKDVNRLALQSPTPLDPSLRSPGDQSEGSGEQTSEHSTDRDEAWVQNMRMIEDLRTFIKERLERGDFEHDDGRVKSEEQERPSSASHSMSEEERNLYPVLRAVQDSE